MRSASSAPQPAPGGQRLRAARAAFAALAELALPAVCGGCGRAGNSWCAGCAVGTRALRFAEGPCRVRPDPCPEGLPGVWAASPYDGPLRAALVAFKDGDRRDLVRVLSPLLAETMDRAVGADDRLAGVLRAGNGPVLVVPVPSSRAALRRRGDAPLSLLLAAALRASPLTGRDACVAPALHLRRRVADQAGLDHLQRGSNLDHAMAPRPRWAEALTGAACILVDDVLTTGATLLEAARALRSARAGHVTAVTVAATQRHGIPGARGVAGGLTERADEQGTPFARPTPGPEYRVAPSWSSVHI